MNFTHSAMHMDSKVYMLKINNNNEQIEVIH